MSQSQDLQQCFQQIQQLISNAEKAKLSKATYAKDKLKDASDAINRYEGYSKTQQSQSKFIFYKQQIKQIERFGMTGEKKKQMDILDQVHEATKEKFIGIKEDIHSALTFGQQAMLDLNRQIEVLDELHKVGNDNRTELKRIKKSLNTLLRGMIGDKCTCGLLILLILGIVTVVVIYFVKKRSAE